MTLSDCPYIKIDRAGFPYVHQTDEQAYLDWVANNTEPCGSQYDDDTVDKMMELYAICENYKPGHSSDFPF